jgi:hypothetical protein
MQMGLLSTFIVISRSRVTRHRDQGWKVSGNDGEEVGIWGWVSHSEVKHRSEDGESELALFWCLVAKYRNFERKQQTVD